MRGATAWRRGERRAQRRRRRRPGATPTGTGALPRDGKRHRHRHRHQDRKDERPEERLGLADELAQPGERQLDERMERAAAVHAHSSRRCRPVSAMNTSSSVPWCVTTFGAPSDAISACGVSSAMTLPVIDDRHAVAEHLGLVHVVRGQQDGAAVGAEAFEDVPQLPPRLRVEAGGRLVEEQQVGIAGQRARHRQPLLLPARQLADPAVPLALELDEPQQLGHVAAAPVERAEQPQRLLDRQLVGQLRFLQLDAEPLPQLVLVASPSAGRALRTSPASGASSPSRISMVVVLPAPFGPSRPKHSPRRTCSDSPSTATTSP